MFVLRPLRTVVLGVHVAWNAVTAEAPEIKNGYNVDCDVILSSCPVRGARVYFTLPAIVCCDTLLVFLRLRGVHVGFRPLVRQIIIAGSPVPR